MTTYNVTYPDHVELPAITVSAEYYQRDGEWATFKDANNKVILDLKLRDVASIARVVEGSDNAARLSLIGLRTDIQKALGSLELAIAETKRLRGLE